MISLFWISISYRRIFYYGLIIFLVLHLILQRTAEAYMNIGTSVPIYSADAVPNAGVVWLFKGLVLQYGRYYIWVEDVFIDALLTKNVRTGGGNTVQAILKYIHTYDKPLGSVNITADVKIWRTYRTRDTGFGQEEKFVIEGEPENIQGFENAVNEELY